MAFLLIHTDTVQAISSVSFWFFPWRPQNEQSRTGWGQQPYAGSREEAILIDIDPINF